MEARGWIPLKDFKEGLALAQLAPGPLAAQLAKAFVDGVTAAAAGAIAVAGFVLGRRAIFDLPTAVIALLALAALTRLKGVSEPVLILAAGVVGIAVTLAGS